MSLLLRLIVILYNTCLYNKYNTVGTTVMYFFSTLVDFNLVLSFIFPSLVSFFLTPNLDVPDDVNHWVLFSNIFFSLSKFVLNRVVS